MERIQIDRDYNHILLYTLLNNIHIIYIYNYIKYLTYLKCSYHFDIVILILIIIYDIKSTL